MKSKTLPEAHQQILHHLTDLLCKEPCILPDDYIIEIVRSPANTKEDLLLRFRLSYDWNRWVDYQEKILAVINSYNQLHSFSYPMDCGMNTWQRYEIAWIFPFNLTQENSEFLKSVNLSIPAIKN